MWPPMWPQSRPIVIIVADSGRKEGRKEDFSNWLLAVTTRRREEVPHTNRTHARLHGHRRQNRDRRERAREGQGGSARARIIRPRRCTWLPRPLAEVIRLLLRLRLPLPPDALQSCLDGVGRETSTSGVRGERLCIAALSVVFAAHFHFPFSPLRLCG